MQVFKCLGLIAMACRAEAACPTALQVFIDEVNLQALDRSLEQFLQLVLLCGHYNRTLDLWDLGVTPGCQTDLPVNKVTKLIQQVLLRTKYLLELLKFTRIAVG